MLQGLRSDGAVEDGVSRDESLRVRRRRENADDERSRRRRRRQAAGANQDDRGVASPPPIAEEGEDGGGKRESGERAQTPVTIVSPPSPVAREPRALPSPPSE
jgi:cytokinesis protein